MESVRRHVAELGRVLLGATFLGGALVHVSFWATNRAVYGEVTPFILFSWYRDLWTGVVLPNLWVLLPALAVVELGIGLAILSSRRVVTAGLLAGVVFNLSVAPLGYWWPANLLLAAGHAVLVTVSFDRTVVGIIHAALQPGAPAR